MNSGKIGGGRVKPFDSQYNFQNRKTLAGGCVFAKNSNAAKYQAAKQCGGKPSDYRVEIDAEDLRRFRAAMGIEVVV